MKDAATSNPLKVGQFRKVAYCWMVVEHHSLKTHDVVGASDADSSYEEMAMASDMVTDLSRKALVPCEYVQAKPAPTIPAVMSVVVLVAGASVYRRKLTTIEATSTMVPYHHLVQHLTNRQDQEVETDTMLKWVDREAVLHPSLEGVQSDHFAVRTLHSVAQLRNTIQP